MQNYSLSKNLLGLIPPALNAVQDVLLQYTIPAARKGNIQIIWLNWGITEEDLPSIPPACMRVFGWRANCNANDYGLSSRRHEAGRATIECGEVPRPGAPGTDLGRVVLESGDEVDAGRALMRGTWNAELYDSFRASFKKGQTASRPDVLIHKNRNSGLYDSFCNCTQYLNQAGIRTLLFAGMNTDQCVMSSLQDAHSRGYDTIMLRDACATDSPSYATQSAEYNLCRNWGFLSDSKALADAVELNKSE
ncbi:uncharacterized protein FPOAC1_013944 [Fusarium poae]|uniref:uncharacterized protein n=1 Tax=Fusarium poae TaxID=36050 RepID=UPI001D05A007|nr:uncharacterized protein FPOAC1_013944 [Fusarium poae]KAG8664237.1 hypothetical protein FPOAC1_013944 [Fusarium poae]